jgi:hypothetical protein
MHTQKKVKCRSEGDMKCFKGFRFILDFQFQRRLQQVKSQANQVKLLRVSFATPCQTVGGERMREFRLKHLQPFIQHSIIHPQIYGFIKVDTSTSRFI